MIDEKGFRLGVVIVVLNDQNRVFWARRIGRNGWQFPQGGIDDGEVPLDAMYRELYEEIGLTKDDVDVISESRRWYYYYLPKHLLRHNSEPLCIGQKQKWFLLRIKDENAAFDFKTTQKPEFEGFRWVSYWYPLRQVIFFKRKMYKNALKQFSSIVFKNPLPSDQQDLNQAC